MIKFMRPMRITFANKYHYREFMVAAATPKTSTGSNSESEGGVRPHPERIARKQFLFCFSLWSLNNTLQSLPCNHFYVNFLSIHLTFISFEIVRLHYSGSFKERSRKLEFSISLVYRFFLKL